MAAAVVGCGACGISVFSGFMWWDWLVDSALVCGHGGTMAQFLLCVHIYFVFFCRVVLGVVFG
jgi:hypothetical protein